MIRRLLILVLSIWPLAASAGLSERQLEEVALTPAPGARAPLGLAFRRAEGGVATLGGAVGGRPTLLLPVDYACRQTCGPALSIAAGALEQTGLRAGQDYSLVVVGLDERDDPEAARRFTDGQIGGPGVSVLVGDREAIRTLTDAIGFHFQQDAENGVIAHPAGFVALAADGRVSHALSSLALTPTDLRLALIEAGNGKVGGVIGRLALLCYGFDAVHGIYTRRIETLLRIGGSLTVVLLALALGGLLWRGGRRGGFA